MMMDPELFKQAHLKAQQQRNDELESKREQLRTLQEQIAEDEREFDTLAAELALGVTPKVRQALKERAE